MSNRLIEIFEDEQLINRIKTRLPYLFHLAELESSRAGKTGMEVGSLPKKHYQVWLKIRCPGLLKYPGKKRK